jgi:hypothetical protein
METRIKWLISDEVNGALLARLRGAFQQKPFSASASRGFILQRTRDNVLSGKFIEKIEGKQSILDPFGRTIELPHLTFHTAEFRISSSTPQLELCNPPQGMRGFFTLLGEAADFQISFRRPEVSVWDWIKAFGRAGDEVRLHEIECRDVVVSGAVAANISFYGTENLKRDSQMLLERRKHRVSRASGLLKVGLREYRVSFAESGTFRISPEADESVVMMAREALAAASA